jgi:hypothetical protein
MANSFSSTDQGTTVEGTEDSQVSTEQTAGNQYSVAGKSFQDWDSVKNSYEHQESHIKTLETERDADRQRISELESKVSQSSTVDELLERIQSGVAAPIDGDIDMAQITQQVASQVESVLQAKEQSSMEEGNWKQVCDQLTTSFGEKVNEQVQAIATKYNMSWDEAIHMARVKPAIFLSLFSTGAQSPSAPTIGSINTSALQDVERETPKVSVMSLRTDAERVANYNDRLDALYAQQGIKI